MGLASGTEAVADIAQKSDHGKNLQLRQKAELWAQGGPRVPRISKTHHLPNPKEPEMSNRAVCADCTLCNLKGFGVVALLECTATWLRLVREHIELVLEDLNQTDLKKVDASSQIQSTPRGGNYSA